MSENKIVLIASTAGRYAAFAPDPNNLRFDRFVREMPDIERRLRAQGLEIVASLAGQSSFLTTGGEERAIVQTVGFGGELQGPRAVAVRNIAVIINRTSRPLRLSSARTMVNNAAVYEIGEDKLAAARLMDPLGLGMPTLPAGNPEELEAALAQFGPSGLALKPKGGSLTEGLYFTATSDEARALMADGAIGSDYIAQPHYDFTGPWPREIVVASNEGGAPEGALYASDIPKELRTFFFATWDEEGVPTIDLYALARVDVESPTNITPAGSRWIGLDQSSIPQRIFDRTTAVALKLGESTNSRALIGCLDSGWGTPIGSGLPPEWTDVELNCCGPRLFGPKEHPRMGAAMHDLYVNFILRAVHSS